eukprot:6382888-Alexandrium_andersonii.AAC.1
MVPPWRPWRTATCSTIHILLTWSPAATLGELRRPKEQRGAPAASGLKHGPWHNDSYHRMFCVAGPVGMPGKRVLRLIAPTGLNHVELELALNANGVAVPANHCHCLRLQPLS